MRCWAVTLELGGRTFEIPALPAADWWPVLVSGNLASILDFVESTLDDPFDLDDLLLEGNLSQGELITALTDAVEVTCGRSLHASMVLAATAKMYWASINGSIARRGFRWDVQPLGAALDAIYVEVLGRLDKEPLEKFLAVLENEALTTGKPTQRQRAAITDEFESIAGPRPTVGVKSSGAPSDNARPKTRQRPRPPRRADPSSEPTQPREPRERSGPPANF